ncbi:MAG: tetratricopeptide repeat protein [Leptospirales bacterium]
MLRKQTLLLAFLGVAFVSSLAADNTISSLRTYQAGIKAFQQKSFYSARLLFQEILNKDSRGEFGDDSQYYIALTYYYEADYKSALFEFRVLLRDYPNSSYEVKARYWEGECFYYLKDYRQALSTHYKFIKDFPESKRAAYAIYTIGYMYILTERYDDAVFTFRDALNKYPKSNISPEIALQLGIAHYNNRDYSKARKQFQSVILRYQDIDTKEAQLWIGKTYFAENKYEDAKAQFLYILEQHTQGDIVPDAKYHLALCYYKTEGPEKTFEVLNDIIANYKKWSELGSAYFRRGQIHQIRENYALAAADYRLVVERYQDSEFYIQALELMADSYRSFGKTDEALRIYQMLLDSFKLKGKARKVVLLKMGNLLLIEKQFEKAARVYQIFYEEYPTDESAPETMFMRSQSLYKVGMYDTALNTLDRLVKKYPHSQWKGDAYFMYGEIYYALTDYTKALQYYNIVLRQYKGHRRFFASAMGVGWSYLELKQYERASDQFRKYEKFASNDSEKAWVLSAIASCRYNLRDFDDAIKYYQNVIKLYPEEPEAEEAYFQIAWVYFRLNDYAQAEKEFITYLEKFPSGKRAPDALYFQAKSLHLTGNYKKAEGLFLKCHKESPEDNPFKERSLLDYAKILALQGDFWGAIDQYRNFLKQYPESVSVEEVYYLLAKSYLQVKQPQHAENVYYELAKKKSASLYRAEILRIISVYFRKRGEVSKADALYRKMIRNAKTTGDKMEAQFARVSMYSSTGQYKEALGICEKLLNSNAEDMEPYRIRLVKTMTEIYASSGNVEMALELIGKQKKNSSNDKNTIGQLTIVEAKIWLMQKEYNKAIKLLKPLLDEQDHSIVARYYSGLAHYYQKKYDVAFDYFRQVSQGRDEFLAAWSFYYLGEIHLLRKAYLKAARDYTKIVYLYSGISDLFERALYKSSLSFKKAGKVREYELYRERLRESFPESKYIKRL